MKLTIFGGFIIVAGAIMFSAGSIDSTGNSWINWVVSLKSIGILTLLSGFVMGLTGVFRKDKTADKD